MANRPPAQIAKFVDDNQYRMDLPSQYYGDEPNSYRKDWDACSVRWVIMASWPYEAAAGNQSIPTVYKSINWRFDSMPKIGMPPLSNIFKSRGVAGR